MYEYSICNKCDEEIFNKQCKALESNIPNLKKKECLIDVDGSKIQKYSIDNKEVKVYNSIDENEVYVISQVELEEYFKK